MSRPARFRVRFVRSAVCPAFGSTASRGRRVVSAGRQRSEMSSTATAGPSPQPPSDGLLLAGGRSRRFGSDKRAAEFRGRTLAENAVRMLRASVGGSVFVAAGRVPAGLARGRDVRIPDAVAGGGPLAGIVAGLRRARSGVLVLACDLPAVRLTTLEHLVRVGRRRSRPTALRCAGGWEPLIAYYPRSALTGLEAALREGLLAPRKVLDALGAHALDGHGRGQLANVNRPLDLEQVSQAG